MSDSQKAPGRWNFEIRVTTPDDQVLKIQQSYPSEYMDGSLVEYHFLGLRRRAVKSLRDRGYFNNG